MNLTKLLKMQKVLDDRIVAEKGLQGVDLLDKKILALLTELGELANEWRGFKFWSEDQEPRDFVPNPDDVCEACNGNPVFQAGDKITGFCDYCDGVGVHFYNPLLEEYADCLSFILSIGNDMKIDDVVIESDFTRETLTLTFIEMFYFVRDLDDCIRHDEDSVVSDHTYVVTLELFLGLGEMLGFTTDQIEQAYFDKNSENHRRQDTNY